MSEYKGAQPFASFARDFFAADKKYGSGDRKTISRLCYHYFRAAALLQKQSMEQAIIRADFLCAEQPSSFLAALDPVLNESVTSGLEKKMELLALEYQPSAIFPFCEELGSGIDREIFGQSHLLQPDLFIRVRPGKHEKVKSQLERAGISFRFINNDCIVLPNGSRLDGILDTDSDAVIQDASSQEVGEMMRAVDWKESGPIQVWDSCAASGGKSILARDIFGKTDLMVSDVRASILANLSKRFRAAGISHYQSLQADLSAGTIPIPQEFDLIIADVPCSGSGTWGRTPEQLLYFRKEQIAEYAALQQSIIRTASTHLKPGGYFLYITCSVFKQENEDQLSFLQKKLRLEPVKAQYIIGYTRRSDTMYAALLRRP